ncbi:hypothetical protein [Devosia sp. Root436]|uniref:hypothetical protein n=1 Tax=Devosia sp. Root436 TaxID=1736537 RepID=UPI0012E395B6|nr:hypothetical protein [Devosia sp. Root436]
MKPLTREQVLASGAWIDETQAQHFGITEDERYAAWLATNASDWHVDHESVAATENVYRRYALHMHALGWSPFPESRADRKPGRLIVWRRGKMNAVQIKPSERRDSRPDWSTLYYDIKGGGGMNVAVVNGAASGHVRCWDIDCLDEDHAEAVMNAAFEVFGPTPFVRVGRAPKVMLIYRVEGDDINLPTRSVSFLDADGQPDLIQKDGSAVPRNALEFLAAGHNWTSYGIHHGTGRSFDWSRGTLHPAIAGPEHAPVITARQIKKFYQAVNAIRPLAGFGSTGSSSPVGGDSEVSKYMLTGSATNSPIWIPEKTRGAWTVDTQGYVIDGREKFLSAMCWAMLSANVEVLRRPGGPDFILGQYIIYCANRVLEDGTWSRNKVERDCRSKFAFALPKWVESIKSFDTTGRWAPKAVPAKLREDGTSAFAQHVTGTPRPLDGSLDWLPEQAGVIPELAGVQKIRKVVKVTKTAEQVAADKASRALVPTLPEREAIHERVAAEVDSAVAAFFADVDRAAAGGVEGDVPVHVVKAPTGSGKTTRTIQYIESLGKRQEGQGQIFVLLPSHDNIGEGLLAAERSGMTVPSESEIDEDAAIAKLKAMGVTAERFMGKKRAGCQRAAEMEALTERGIGASGLCGGEIEEGGDELLARMKKKAGERPEKTQVLCEFRARGECGYWNQMTPVSDADVVFLPHAFLTMMSLPKVLKNARAIIIDESVTYQVLHQSRLDLEILLTPRKAPFVTKKELALHPGRTAEDIGSTMLAQRDEIAGDARAAILAGACPAAAIRDAGKAALVETAITVIKRARTEEREITPLMTATDIEALASRPKGKALIEEEKLWKIIADRIAALDAGTATGDRDERLQLVYVPVEGKPKPFVRMSWRSTPNWQETPKLLLDASVNPKVVAKLFGSEPVVHDIQAPLHLRTILIADRPYANRAFIPGADATTDEVEAARRTVQKTRALVSKAAGAYTHSRVLMGSTIAVRETLAQGAWTPPQNVDNVHFGALRGLDGFKHHAVAISIGRSEQPIHVVDGYAAALTYDDPSPQPPYDVTGTGYTSDGKPLFREGNVRRIELRTGEDYEHYVPMLPGAWAQILEGQWREEELRQFVGRLRPVYRGAAPAEGQSDEMPLWICQSKTMPTGFIVDEVFTLDDMAANAEFYDLVRLSDGVLADEITARLPGCGHVFGIRLAAWSREVLPDVPALYRRLISSMHCVRFRLDGRDKIARVAAWHDDPAAALLRAAKVAGVSIEVTSVEMAERERVTAAKPRPHDRIDANLAAIAPFGDPRMLLQDREIDLRRAHARIEAAGSRMTLAELEDRWRSMDLDTIVEIETCAFEHSQWVRVYDGEELEEVMPHYLEAA